MTHNVRLLGHQTVGRRESSVAEGFLEDVLHINHSERSRSFYVHRAQLIVCVGRPSIELHTLRYYIVHTAMEVMFSPAHSYFCA